MQKHLRKTVTFFHTTWKPCFGSILGLFWSSGPKFLKEDSPNQKKKKKIQVKKIFFFFAVTSCKKSDFFLQKIRPCHFISQMNFIQKIRKCLQAVQQKNLWTNGQTNGEYFIEPSLHASIKLHYLCCKY